MPIFLYFVLVTDNAREALGMHPDRRRTCYQCQSWADHAHDPVTGKRVEDVTPYVRRHTAVYLVLLTTALYLSFGLAFGWVEVHGWSVWLAVPWDWHRNVDVGLYAGKWFFMLDTV